MNPKKQSPNIYSKNIPAKNTHTEWNLLRKKMLQMAQPVMKQKYIGYSSGTNNNHMSVTGGNGMVIPSTIGTAGGVGGYNWTDPYEPESNTCILFYGFTGLLPLKYSAIKDMSEEDIQAKMMFAGKKVPYCIKDEREWFDIVSAFNGTPNALTEIDFDDAMNIIRIGINENRVEIFEDAEVDEFDDNCLETCRPGDHKCGK